MNEETLFRASARAITEQARSLSGTHPGPDELLAYQRREVSPRSRQTVQEHLALCHSCTQLVLDLETFPKLEPRGNQTLTSQRVAAAWEQLRDKIEAAAPPTRRAWPLSLSLSYGLTALLVAGIVGLCLWVVELRKTVDELRDPRLDVTISDLIPVATSRTRSERSTTVVRWPASSDHLMLLLNLADFREMPDYLLKIEDETGRTVWSRRGLRRTPDGHFTLELSRGYLPSGTYYLSLFGLGSQEPDAERILLVQYSVDLMYE